MKLAQYLTEKNITPEQFASDMDGMSVSGVRKWMYGERVPRPDQMRKIAELTGGLVEPNDFILPITAERFDAMMEGLVPSSAPQAETAS